MIPSLPQPPSVFRRLLVGAAFLVPLVVDPVGVDTQHFKRQAFAIAGCLALAVAGIERLRGGTSTGGFTWPERLLFLFSGWCGLSYLWAPNGPHVLGQFCLYLGLAGLVYSVRQWAVGVETARRILVGCLGVGALAITIDGLAIAQGSPELAASAVKFSSDLFVHNNMAAGYAMLLAPLAFALMVSARPANRALVWGLLLAGIVAYLYLLDSRAGVVGAVVGIGTVTVLLFMRRRFDGIAPPSRRTKFYLFLLLLLFLAIPFSEGIRGGVKDGFYRVIALLELDWFDYQRRMILWAKAMRMVEEAPLLGVGAGNFHVLLPKFEHLRTVVTHAHNDAVHVLAELGLVGLALFLSMLGAGASLLVRSLAAIRRRESFAVVASVGGMLVVFVIGGFFEVPFGLASSLSLLVLGLGVVGALGRTEVRPKSRWEDGKIVATMMVMIGLGAALWTGLRLPAASVLRRAEARFVAQDLGAAESLYRRLVSLSTGSAVPYRGLAKIAMARGEPDLALSHLRDARKMWPYTSDLIAEEGEVLLEMGDAEGALKLFRLAVALSPEDHGARYGLVHALAATNQRGEAISRLEHEVRTDAELDPAAIRTLAHLWWEETGDLEGDAKIEAMVAARHFYAMVIEEADADLADLVNERFANITHLLQMEEDAPQSWWHGIYMPWLERNSWGRIASPFHYTNMVGEPVKILPGWEEALGPPLPRKFR